MLAELALQRHELLQRILLVGDEEQAGVELPGGRVGAVGVSGLPGPDDDAAARAGIRAAGFDTPA